MAITTYVINRDDRPERLRDTIEELRNAGMNAKRFPAIIDKPGWKGCRDSHLAVMELCRNEKYFMIFEDDIEFLTEPSAVMIKAIEQLPKDWDMLYLGLSPQKPQERYSENLFKVNGAYCTHAILWNNRFGGALKYILLNKVDILKIDVYLSAVIHPKFNCFATYPMIVTQKQTKSDCCSKSDLSTLVKNYNKYCV
jgi:GR25 family glycosyltransferase involved in LPS biosynthesis